MSCNKNGIAIMLSVVPDGDKEWRNFRGMFCRVDGPADIWFSGPLDDGKIMRRWFRPDDLTLSDVQN